MWMTPFQRVLFWLALVFGMLIVAWAAESTGEHAREVDPYNPENAVPFEGDTGG